MNPEIKHKWIQALRSGAYKQGAGFLKKVVDGKFRYCCLGVLADIAVGQGILESAIDAEGIFNYRNIGSHQTPTRGLLPSDSERWCDLHESEQQNLAQMNDWGRNFNQIADYIEENL